VGCGAPEVRASAANTPAARLPAPVSAAASVGPVRLEFVDDYNPPRPRRDEELEAPGARWDVALGGLSGLHYERVSGILFAISDLPRRFGPRMYSFGVRLTDAELHVEPRAVQLLHERDPAARGRVEWLDAECITSDGSGGFYIGTETGDERPDPAAARIIHMDRDGLLTEEIPLPEAYVPTPNGVPRGTRSNRAFEGLSLSPSGRWLTAILESTLRQDGDEATFEHGALVRLLRWDRSGASAPVEYLYPLEALPRPTSGTPNGGNNGVAELLSLDDRRLLVLERAYVPLAEGQGPNTIRIFEVDVPEVPGAAAVPATLEKQLVLDLAAIVERLEPGAQSLDNIEGMTIGPDLPSGAPSLLLVSDDNFRAEQRTVFLAFRVVGLER
jgi:hypothetical protein